MNDGRRKRAALPTKQAAKRRNKKPPTEDEDSDSSVENTPQVEGNRTPSPLPEEPTTTLPEVIIILVVAHISFR